MVDGKGSGCRRNRAWHRARWHEHVEAWARSGGSAAAYCRLHRLRPKSFYRWRRIFSDAVSRDNKPGSPVPTVEPRMMFAEVRPAAMACVPALEVVVPPHRVVRVPAGFDAATLAEVVRVLEGLGPQEAQGC